jgi:hypothetical protein
MWISEMVLRGDRLPATLIPDQFRRVHGPQIMNEAPKSE